MHLPGVTSLSAPCHTSQRDFVVWRPELRSWYDVSLDVSSVSTCFICRERKTIHTRSTFSNAKIDTVGLSEVDNPEPHLTSHTYHHSFTLILVTRDFTLSQILFGKSISINELHLQPTRTRVQAQLPVVVFQSYYYFEHDRNSSCRVLCGNSPFCFVHYLHSSICACIEYCHQTILSFCPIRYRDNYFHPFYYSFAVDSEWHQQQQEWSFVIEYSTSRFIDECSDHSIRSFHGRTWKDFVAFQAIHSILC